MTKNVLSPHWTGSDRAEPIDPAMIRFKVAEAPIFADCEGCLFINQFSPVCRRAAELSGHDCDDPLPNGRSAIFVLDKSDPRQVQMDLEIVGQGGATADAISRAPITNN